MNFIKNSISIFFITVLWVISAHTLYAQKSSEASKKKNPLARLEAEILAFEKKDKVMAPQKDAILFVGSSSVRFWRTLKKDMAPLPVINRGFGGSTFPELLYYYDRIVLPYQPKAIVVYEGDNDLTLPGMTPEKVLQNLKTFYQRVQKDMPGTKVWFIAIKPSIAREHLLSTLQKTNQMIQELAASTDNLEYLDVANPMLNKDGTIKADIFIRDNLHMNIDGYKLWKEAIRPVLLSAYVKTAKN